MTVLETVLIAAGVALATALLAAVVAIWVLRYRSREAPQAYLYQRKGKRVVKYELCDDICRIGRHHDNEVHLNHHSVSRFHAQIVNNRNGSFLIRDLDSKNGVKVFFRHVNSTVLHDGDIIYVGDVPLKFTRYPMDYKTVPDTVVVSADRGQRFKKRQRHIERFAVNRAVRFYIEHMGWHIGKVLNLSEEGLFIKTNQKIQLRTPIDIVMQDEHDNWIKVTGEVTRKEPDGVGVVFTDVDRDTKVKLYNIGRAGAEPPPESLGEIESYLDAVSDKDSS